EYVPWLLPHHVLDVTMNYLDPNTDPLGVAALVLLGAWLSASSWGAGGTLSLALTQGQSRAKVVLGQATTAIFLAAFSALASLAVAVIASELLRLALTGDGSLPSIGHLAAGVGETLLITSMYVAIGWTIGLLVKSTAVAMVIVLGWVLVLQPTVIDYVGPLAHGVVHWIYNILPGTPALTLAYAQGTNNSLYGGGITPTGGPPGLTTSIWLLCAYTLIAIAIAAVIAARREVHGRQA
ncbi:MAG TPA: ABC transporter permease subunit, partial [Mycobacterium sp.]